MEKFPNKLKAVIFLIHYPTSYFTLLEEQAYLREINLEHGSLKKVERSL
jgi:hypothetical protein